MADSATCFNGWQFLGCRPEGMLFFGAGFPLAGFYLAQAFHARSKRIFDLALERIGEVSLDVDDFEAAAKSTTPVQLGRPSRKRPAAAM